MTQPGNDNSNASVLWWGVLLKCQIPPNEIPPSVEHLQELERAISGPYKRLTGSDHDFTIAWWVEGRSAAEATATAGAEVRERAKEVGLPSRLIFVRAHVASVAGRLSPFDDPAAHIDGDDWGIDVKVTGHPGHPGFGRDTLDRVAESMGLGPGSVTFRGDIEKFLVDDGSGFTVRWWIQGKDPAEAFRRSRAKLASALSAIGLREWTIDRFKGRTPRDLAHDSFPGAIHMKPVLREELK